MTFTAATLRVDAVGLLGAILLTGAGVAIARTPALLSHGPTRQQQTSDLDTLKKQGGELDKQIAVAHARVNELTAQSNVAVKLLTLARMNKRMADITEAAESAGTTLVQITPAPALATNAESKSVIIPIKISGTGSYPAVTTMIRAFHDQFRDTAVTGLHLNALSLEHPADNGKATYTLDLAWHTALAGPAGAPPKSE